MSNEKKSKKPIAIICAMILVAAVIGVVVFINSGKLTASTMRMLRTEGVVKLFENEKEKTISDNLRLNAGNVLNTRDASLAGIALDDTKIVTINELSNAQFDQKGKKLDINLTDGSLFFEVTKKLDSDETFDIRTSTMVVGIRGTSGYVATDKNGNDVVVITDGQVEVTGRNPVTGEVKTITVKAGERVTTYLYNDRTVDSIMFEKDDLNEEDLDLFIVKRLAESERLITLVCEDTGWSREKILGIADGGNSDVMYADGSGNETAGESGAGAGSAAGNAGGGAGAADGAGSGGAGAGGSAGDGSNGAPAGGDGTGNGGNGSDGSGASGNGGTDVSGGNAGSADGSANALTAGAGDGSVAGDAASTAATTSKSGAAAYVASVDSSGVMHLTNGGSFDPGYYAKQNPDVVSEVGTDPYKLLEHYLAFGDADNRYGTAAEQQQAEAAKQAEYMEFVEALDRANAEAAEEAKKAAASSGGGSDKKSSSSSSGNGQYTYSGGEGYAGTNTGTAGGP